MNKFIAFCLLFAITFAKSYHVKFFEYDRWLLKEFQEYICKINKDSCKYSYNIAFYTIVYSKIYKVDPLISFCVMKAESHFDVDADSGTAAGLMQVNYRYWNIEKEKLISNIQYSIKTGVKVLRYTIDLVDKMAGVEKADEVPLWKVFVVYHGGPRRFYTWKLNRVERIYIKNIYRCLDYFDKKYYKYTMQK